MWTDGSGLKPHARALLRDLCGRQPVGVNTAIYRTEALVDAVARFSQKPERANRMILDSTLTHAFKQYAGDLLRGRIDPKDLGSNIYLEVPRVPIDSVMRRLLATRAPKSIHEAVKPRHPEFVKLEQALSDYRRLEVEGGWSAIPDGEVVKAGERDARIPALRRRLAVTGDIEDGAVRDDSLFDTDVRAGLAHFQRRHGLDVDSVLGPSTIEALNVPIEDRVRQIELTLERWRWLPRKLGDRHITVNIPSFLVRAYDRQGQVLSMKAVVGSELEERRTPVFSDAIDYIVFRPYWNVPEAIVVNEIIPNIERDSRYLENNDYEIVDEDGEVVSRSEIDEKDVVSGKYRVRQRPGPANSLGLIKFVFPNPHNVYLHDTPADHLFAESERDFSHGCVRLEDPVRLAMFVLEPQGWTKDEIEDALQGERQRVELSEPVPVYIMYMTAFVDDDGTVAFRSDLYGFDEALDRALTEHDRKELARVDTTRSSCELIRRVLDEV